MRRLFKVLVCFLAAPSSLLLAADCSALKDLKLADTTITLAQPVTSGDLTIPGVPAPLRNLPAFCRVTGIMRPTSDSKIRFEVWLPQQDWNGRYLGVGNGGFAGTIGYQEFAAYLKRGFAVAGSDTGHQAEVTDASWAYGHPEKVKDFGWRAVHLTAVLTPQIIAAYYGKPQQKSYFDSCSDGGREALMEAQRFPNDYDGILAGAPANAWSSLLSAGVATLQNLTEDPRSYISGLKLPAIQKAALDACDAPDGVKDGFINNPAQCHFDPAVLLCKADDELDCLTQPQIDALKKLYQGATDSKGNLLFPGFSMGDETSWGPWIVGQDPGGAMGSQFVLNYFRYIVTGDPKWNVLTADMDRTLRQAKEKSAADLDATNPDLGPFAARGGKLILYHGWNDPAISPWNTIAYFNEVQKTVGAEKAASFTRLYMIPGMEHCLGGPGPSTFGQFGLSTAKGPTNGLFDSLEDWVEKGSPADDVVATKYAPGPDGAIKPVITRPLCPYPAVAKYKGSGDTTDATNFTCEKP
jgi:feruloyl esterase